MHEEMQEYKIILTWEAIYDVTDIADYIEEEFGQQHADRRRRQVPGLQRRRPATC